MKSARIKSEIVIDLIENDEDFALDPADILQQKIEGLAEILGCSEEIAEKVLFDRL